MEDPWKGTFSNDQKFGRQLVWSRQHKLVLSNPEVDLKLLAKRLARRVKLIRSVEEAKRMIEADEELLVVYASLEQGQYQSTVREIDSILPDHIRIAVIENPGLLKTFGIVADSRVWTVRYIRKEMAQPDDSIDRYSFSSSEKVWRKVPPSSVEVTRHYNLPLDVAEISAGLKKIANGEVSPWTESEGDLIRFSEVLDANQLSLSKKRKRPSVIKFYRPQCVSCERLAPAYEKLSEEVYKIQTYLEAHPDDLDIKGNNPVTKYNLKHPKAFRHLRVAAASTTIDCDDFEVTKTPTIMVVSGGKTQEIDLLKEKFDVDDVERFVYRMMRTIDSLLAD